MKRCAISTKQAGAVTVEMALVAPLLIFLLFGILEIGLVIKDYLGINQAGREGVRSAALAASCSAINTRIRASAPTIDTTQLTWQAQWRQYHPIAGTWDASWTTLADRADGTGNNAPTDAQIKITVTYPHHLVTGRLFSFLATNSAQPDIITLQSNMVMRRE